METQFSKSAQAALYKMIHQTAGIDPKQIAEIIGDSHKTVLNYANPNMDYLPSLKSSKACCCLPKIGGIAELGTPAGLH